MKKGLCLLVSIAMLLGLCAPMALAAGTAEETVFFETDFENTEIGERPSKDSKHLGFDGSAVKDPALIEVVSEGGSKVIKYFLGENAEKPGGPRVEKNINTRGLKEFTIEYDFITSGGESTLSLMLYDKSTKAYLTAKPIADSAATKWTRMRVEVNLDKLTAVCYAADKKVKESEITSADVETLTIWFGSSVRQDGSYFMLDNIKIYTKQKGYNPDAGMNPDDIKAPYNAADAVPESGDIAVLVEEDFETQTVGEMFAMRPKGGFETSALKAAAPMMVREENGNKYGHLYHGAPETEPSVRGPYVGKNLSLTGLNTLVVDYDVKSTKNGGSTLSVVIYNNDTGKWQVSVLVPTNFDNWTHTKVRFDFVKKTAKVYVAGKLFKEYPVDLGGLTMGNFRFLGQIHPDGSDYMLDNIKVTSPDKNAGGIVTITGEFNAENVKLPEAEKTGMTTRMRKTHPRVMLNDWQAVRAKIDTDENYKIWFKRLTDSANNILRNPPVEYVVNARNNINESSTQAKTNMITLAGAYGMTGDVRYKDRLYAELENVGNWPNWDGKTYLCTAHLILGASIAYDWLYNDWTPQERENIKNWLVQKGASQAVLGYEGQISGTGNWINSVSNWNNVCNGANTIMAIALADEYPELSEYIFSKASDALQASFVEVSADGAYAETVGYWDYGVRYQVKMMASLESALADGQVLPERLDYTDNTGLNNTGDFPIYYNGTTGAFNYGDGEVIMKVSPILYWFATKYDKPRYAWYNLYMINNYAEIDHPKDHNTIYSILWYDPEHTAKADPAAALDKFYSSTEPNGANGISMRSSWADQNAMVVMAHAGDAGTGHINHDAGGFVLDWAGKRWVHMYGRTPAGQTGAILYAWDGYFSIDKSTGGRFQYYHTRGEANNTIIANPKQGESDMKPKYYAEVERFDSNENTGFGIINMTQTNEDYVSAKRGFMLTDMRETLVIQDEIKAKKPSEYYWFANTLASITIASDGKSALLEMDGDQMLVRITQGPEGAKLGAMPTSPLPTSPNPSVQKPITEEKLFIHIENVQDLNLTVEFIPLKKGEGVPAPLPVVPLDAWSVANAAEMTTSQSMGDIVALKVDNPNAYAKGAKTYVDTNNIDIKPIVENGRTLVPVRFIAEKFGAVVGWDAVTQTVSVDTITKSVRLQLGSTQMLVDGNPVTLDVPAKEIGGRTLIPLRALVEALGKQVFWDDRGLIIISDAAAHYDAQTIDSLIDLLDIRVQIDGKELSFFDNEVYTYYVGAEDGTVPTVSASAMKGAVVAQGNPATVTVGDKVYTFHFTRTPLAMVYGDVNAVRKLEVKPNNGPKPTEQNYLQIQSATSSLEWTPEKYPMTGTYDNIIHESNTLNRWSANGAGHWVAYDLGSVQNLHSIAIAGYLTASRAYTFELAVSQDGENWEVVNTGAQTTSGADHNVFSLCDKQARYVRVTGLAATGTTWIGICETRIYGSAEMEAKDQTTWSSEFYPNKVHGTVGTVRKLDIYGVNGRGEAVAMDLSALTITVDNPAIASVDAQGNVTLLAPGNTQVTVSGVIGGNQRKYTVEVAVL